jgi:hypothetical protein
MFCNSGLVFGGINGIVSRIHVLRARTCFQRYRGRRVPFSCFARPDSFLAVPRASGPVFMFCTPGLVFGGTEGVGSRFHVLCARTRFRRYCGREVPFSCFYTRTRFRRYRWRKVTFSCFALPDSFSTIPRAWVLFSRFARSNSFPEVPRSSGPIFLFCSPGLVFGGTEGVGSRFHVLRAQSRFQRYRGRRVPFSCFVFPDSFSAAPRTSGAVFIVCAPVLVFGSTEGVSSHFHVFRSRTYFRRY